MNRQGSPWGSVVAAAVLVAAAAVVAWWYVSHRPAVTPANAPAISEPAPTASAAPAIRYPIGDAANSVPASAATAPLPALDGSDAAIVDALSSVPGAAGLRDLLLAQGVIPHFVATVDALPRHTIGSSILPMHTPSGAFAVAQNGNAPTIAPANYARYDAYMRVAAAINTRALVGWYVRWYPLFQQAYRDLGYPNGYFNDRAIAAIDDMLGAPEPASAPALTPAEHGLYAFADPALESLSVGQKLMIRVGPQNEARLKAKLRAIRAALTGRMPARDVPSGTSATGDATG